MHSGKKWEISKDTLKILSFLSSPKSIDEIISPDIRNKKQLASLLKNLMEAGILVKENQDKSKLLDGMCLTRSSNNYLVYTDKISPNDEWSGYTDIVDYIIGLIKDKFEINLKIFNICIFTDEKFFNNLCGKSIPKWATCFVHQDCIVQKAEDASLEQAAYVNNMHYNIRGMIHEIGHIISYSYCRHLPNWLSEGLSEYFANTLCPLNTQQNSKSNSLPKELLFFMKNPEEMLINHNSKVPQKNELYSMANLFVENILHGKNIKLLLSTLSNFDLITPMPEYLANNGFKYN